MVGINLDPFSALEKWKEWQSIKRWAELIVELGLSFWLSLCFVAGSALAAHRPPWEALGEGLVAAAVMTAIHWSRSPLTKGMMLVLPGKIGEKELEAEVQVTERR